MTIVDVSSTYTDLSDLLTKMQAALVPTYFEAVTLTPCAGASPTESDPSTITCKVANKDVYVDFMMGGGTLHNNFQLRGNDITGTGVIRLCPLASPDKGVVPIQKIIITDYGVVLYGANVDNLAAFTWTATPACFVIIGKTSDGGTGILAPAQFANNDPWAITKMNYPSTSNNAKLLSVDLCGGKTANDYTYFASVEAKTISSSYVIMGTAQTINGAPFEGIYIPKYNPFSDHPAPFEFTLDSTSYCGVAACGFVLRN